MSTTASTNCFLCSRACTKNICVVGDDDQCVVEGTPILTPSGYVPVEQIREGDTLLAACGGPHLAPAVVEKVMVNDYSGPVRHIQMEHGESLSVTPNHVMFQRLVLNSPVEVKQENGYFDKSIENEITFIMFSDGMEYGTSRSKPAFYIHADQTCHTAMFNDYEDAWNYARRLQSRVDAPGINTSAQMSDFRMWTRTADLLTTWHNLPIVMDIPSSIENCEAFNGLPKSARVFGAHRR